MKQSFVLISNNKCVLSSQKVALKRCVTVTAFRHIEETAAQVSSPDSRHFRGLLFARSWDFLRGQTDAYKRSFHSVSRGGDRQVRRENQARCGHQRAGAQGHCQIVQRDAEVEGKFQSLETTEINSFACIFHRSPVDGFRRKSNSNPNYGIVEDCDFYKVKLQSGTIL